MNRVLLVAPQPFYAIRGTPINVRAVASTLADGGYDVTLLTLPFGEDIRIKGVTIKRVRRIPLLAKVPIGPSLAKLAYLIVFCWTVWRMTRREPFQLLHGIEEGAFAVGVTGIFRKIPFVADVDSCMPTQLRDSGCGKIPGIVALFERIERYFIKRSRAAITVCSALTEKVRRIEPLLPIYQIEGFPFSDALKVENTKLSELRRRFPIDGKKLLLYTGNLEPYQGVELLLRSFAGLRAANVLLVIVGGPLEKVAFLKTLALELGISDRVQFEGERPPADMGSYMAIADILVSPRLFGENVPLKLYTYLASGKPLVATRIYSHTQIVDEHTAFLGDPRSDDFGKALERAINSPALAEISSRARKLVEERYSEESFKRRLLATYAELLPLSVANNEPLHAHG